MPISISGSGTITGIGAGGLPDGCVTGDDIANNAVTVNKLGTTEQGQLCKAWVNFNGTGVIAIRASYNVSSITDNGVGDYTVNFTTAMPNANYVTVGAGGGSSVAALFYPNQAAGSAVSPSTTTSIRCSFRGPSSTTADTDWIHVAIFC